MNLKSKRNIAVDFDGVIHKYSKGFQDGTIYDGPIEGAKEALETLSRKYNVIIFTTRLSPIWKPEDTARQERQIKEWLAKHGFPDYPLTGSKPVAMYYIDDRAIRFENWDDTLNIVDMSQL